MRSLTVIEFFALFFTGVAGLAAAIQAYVTYETRGEVTRAIIFSEQINACADLMSALDPITAEATEEKRARLLENGRPDADYFPALYYFPGGTTSEAFAQRHRDILRDWNRASAAFKIVMPQSFEPRVVFFDQVVRERMTDYGDPMNREEFVKWLERIDMEADRLVESCRGVV